MVAEDVIAASADLEKEYFRRLGSGALGKDVDEIVRGRSAVSASNAGVLKYISILYMIYH